MVNTYLLIIGLVLIIILTALFRTSCLTFNARNVERIDNTVVNNHSLILTQTINEFILSTILGAILAGCAWYFTKSWVLCYVTVISTSILKTTMVIKVILAMMLLGMCKIIKIDQNMVDLIFAACDIDEKYATTYKKGKDTDTQEEESK